MQKLCFDYRILCTNVVEKLLGLEVIEYGSEWEVVVVVAFEEIAQGEGGQAPHTTT